MNTNNNTACMNHINPHTKNTDTITLTQFAKLLHYRQMHNNVHLAVGFGWLTNGAIALLLFNHNTNLKKHELIHHIHYR